MTALLPQASDIAAHDAKARSALGRFRIDRVTSAGSEFADAYGALEDEFSPRGELERRAVIEGWLGSETYWLLVAKDGDGRLAGVRDCHVIVDRVTHIAVVYLAHVLVLPPYRRTGLGGLLRAAPLTIGRRAVAAAGIEPLDADLLLAAEMEPVDRAAPETIVRLVAYAREGFAAISPRHLPYCQPDFRDPRSIDGASGGISAPLPLLAVVRWVDHEGARTIPARLAAAYVEHLYQVFATHCRERDLAVPREHALATLHASGDRDVPLLPLPSSPTDGEALARLDRAVVLAHYPADLASAIGDNHA